MNKMAAQFGRGLSRRYLLKIASTATMVSAYFISARGALADPEPSVLSEPAVEILSPSRVFLIAVTRAGNRILAAGEQGVILYSDDNGASWRQAKVPVSVALVAIDFADPLHGWAVGALGVILKTSDGGLTWQKCLDGVQANVLMSQNAAAFAAKSPDAPAAARALRRAGILTDDGPDIPFLCVLAIAPQSAIAFGAYRLVMRTDDGGKTWSDLSLAVDDPVSHNLYGVARIGSRIFVAAETGLVFCSTDGGQTFPQVTSPTSTTLFGVCPAGGGSVLVYGVAGQIFRSQDFGQTWSPSAINLAEDVTFACGDSNQVIASSESGLLFVSSDGGGSFSPLPGYSPNMQVNAFTPMQNGQLLLVGSLGPEIAPR